MSTALTRWIGHERVDVPKRAAGAYVVARLLPWLEPIVRSLSKRRGGRAKVHYATLRAMLWQDHRYACGDESIRVALAAAQRQGLCSVRRVSCTSRGGAAIEIRLPGVAEQRAEKWREKRAKREQRTRTAAAKRLERTAHRVGQDAAHQRRRAEEESARGARRALAAVQIPAAGETAGSCSPEQMGGREEHLSGSAPKQVEEREGFAVGQGACRGILAVLGPRKPPGES